MEKGLRTRNDHGDTLSESRKFGRVAHRHQARRILRKPNRDRSMGQGSLGGNSDRTAVGPQGRYTTTWTIDPGTAGAEGIPSLVLPLVPAWAHNPASNHERRDNSREAPADRGEG